MDDSDKRDEREEIDDEEDDEMFVLDLPQFGPLSRSSSEHYEKYRS